jgi:hypothetical protein
MSKHHNTWLPGDDVGYDEMDAAEIILNSIKLNS